jgi:hypothetical protein
MTAKYDEFPKTHSDQGASPCEADRRERGVGR